MAIDPEINRLSTEVERLKYENNSLGMEKASWKEGCLKSHAEMERLKDKIKKHCVEAIKDAESKALLLLGELEKEVERLTAHNFRLLKREKDWKPHLLKLIDKQHEALESIALSDPYGPTYPGNVARKALKGVK